MAEEDAKTILRNALSRYKLGDLTDEAWKLVADGTIPANADVDTIGDALRDTPQFQARFPANKARMDRGLPELSVSEYIGLERGYENAMRGSGLPQGFFDSPEDFSNFIGQNISVAEIQTRVNDGFKAVSEANPQVIAQMKELYGVDEGGLAAYFLDPAKATPILQRQAKAASIGAEAQRQARMQLTAQAAETLAREGATGETAAAGFRQIAEDQKLYAPAVIGEQQITQEEQIAGTFGTDQEVRQRIATRQRRRRAAFEQTGSLAAGATGITGLRNA